MIVAIFKNESHVMEEWLNHYIQQGVTHFYMTDNGSTDNWQHIVEGKPVTMRTDPKKHAQEWHYNEFLTVVKDTADWVLVVDLDEFMYARNGDTLTAMLDNYPSTVGQIRVRWKDFGSHGHIEQPLSVVHGFTSRMNGAHALDTDTKSFTRTAHLVEMGIHKSKTIQDCDHVFEPAGLSEDDLQLAPIHLNHYRIQSRDWFMNVKMTRGDGVNPQSDAIRNLEYFQEWDYREQPDSELSDLYKGNPVKKTMVIMSPPKRTVPGVAVALLILIIIVSTFMGIWLYFRISRPTGSARKA